MSSIAVKAASTALIRMIRAGKLSAPSIARAAQGMDPGQFRFLRNLGRGQFNMADEVVGNVGNVTGQLVRKLPAHAYSEPQDAYKGLKSFVDQTNQQIPTPSGAPLIAPYEAVNSRGAFQQLANRTIHTPRSLDDAVAATARDYGIPKSFLDRDSVARLPLPEALRTLDDLHPGNIGPGGQIIDFTAPKSGLGWAPRTAQRVSTSGIAPNPTHIPGGFDELANLADRTPAQQAQYNAVNNSIRRFYAQPTAVRQNYPGAVPRMAGMPTQPMAATQTWRPQPHAAQRALQQTLDQHPPVSNWQPPQPRRPSNMRRIAPYVAGGAAAGGGGGLLYDYIRSRGGK